MSDPVQKKEKKDKKRKSEVAAGDVSMASAVAPEPVPPPAGTASAEAVVMEVDGEKAAKKAKKEKKEKRKSTAALGADESVVVDGQGDAKVSCLPNSSLLNSGLGVAEVSQAILQHKR